MTENKMTINVSRNYMNAYDPAFAEMVRAIEKAGMGKVNIRVAGRFERILRGIKRTIGKAHNKAFRLLFPRTYHKVMAANHMLAAMALADLASTPTAEQANNS